MRSIQLTLAMLLALIVGVACSNRANTASVGDSVKKALEQAGIEFLNHGQPGVRLKAK